MEKYSDGLLSDCAMKLVEDSDEPLTDCAYN